MKPGVKVYKAKRKSNWGNPIIDKLMQLKYSINDVYHSNSTESPHNVLYLVYDDKNYVMKLIQDVRKHNLKKLSKEDGLKCNGLWRKYAR